MSTDPLELDGGQPSEQQIREAHPDWTDQQVHDELVRLGDPDDASKPDPSAGKPAGDDQQPESPSEPVGRLRIGEDTKGRYIILCARKPARGDTGRPRYVEIACVAASSPEAAKKGVMEKELAGEAVQAYLRHSAAQKPGILLRAVPAMHWPETVEPTTFWRPEPVLKIG